MFSNVLTKKTEIILITVVSSNELKHSVEHCNVVFKLFVSPSRRRRFATGMTHAYVAVVTPPKFRVTWATSRGRPQGLVDFIQNWKTWAVSTTDGWLKLNFASWVIRQTRGLGALMLYLYVVWCLCIKSTIGFLILSHTSLMVGRSHVLYVFLMQDIGPWLPWVLQGSTERLYKDDAAHTYSAHIYDMTRTEARGNICMVLLHVQQNQIK